VRPAVRGSLLWALVFALAPASAAHAVGVSIVSQTRSVFADGIVEVVDVDTAEDTDARDA
jgi:hypothetical protein